jgi:L-fucono-1,5-lactonase
MSCVDSHLHFWRLDRGDYSWLGPESGHLYQDFEPEQIAAELRESEVERVVVVQAAPTEAETRYLFELAERHPFIAGVVGWVDFGASDVAERIEGLVRDGGGNLKGLRPMVQDIADPEWLGSPQLDRAFQSMIEHGLAFDALVTPRHLSVLAERLARHPSLRAVVDHAAKPDAGEAALDSWSRDIERIAQQTSAHCKLSGLLTQGKRKPSLQELDRVVGFLVRTFGAQRLCWGSDWPVLTLRGQYAEWLRMARTLVSAHALGCEEQIFGTNAARLYRLTGWQD